MIRCATGRLPVSMRAVQDKQQDDDDLEAILAELDGKPQPAQAPGSTDSAAAPASAESVPTEPPAEDAENTAVSLRHPKRPACCTSCKKVFAVLDMHTPCRS